MEVITNICSMTMVLGGLVLALINGLRSLSSAEPARYRKRALVYVGVAAVGVIVNFAMFG